MVPMVRAGALSGYKQLLRHYGGDADALLAELSLPADYLDQPDRLIPLSSKVDLLELAARRSGCAHFGLELGQQQNISMLGMIGLLIQQSATVREALYTISESIGQHVQSLEVTLEEKGDLAFFRFVYCYEESGAPSRQHNDNTLMSGYNIIGFLLNEPLKLRSVYLRGEEPKDLAPYNALLHAPLVFNHSDNMLVFDRAYLDHPVAGADPALRGMINAMLNKKQLDSFQERLLWIITNLLPHGHVTLNMVAEAVVMAPRTLQLHLKRQGTTFQQLLDRARVEEACRIMLNSDLPLTEVADLVGYSQISALTRGFKRIMGSSPASWRKSQRQTAQVSGDTLAPFVK